MPENPQISVEKYRYELPQGAIARYPLERREDSRLLVYDRGRVDHWRFSDLSALIPRDSWMVFNNTRVIQARLVFRKPTGARIEVFCLEPAAPSDYHLSFGSTEGCTWKCMVGNARKWKSGRVSLTTRISGREVVLYASLEQPLGDSFLVRFDWEDREYTFSEIIERAGSTPIPPYLNREAEESDRERYQTVYSLDPGSVAAPTAGLHFTDEILEQLAAKGVGRGELTLHVGAGTFVPVKHENARDHRMHSELVQVSRSFLEEWHRRKDPLVAVGTTTTRSLETLYWLGVKLLSGETLDPLFNAFRQWDNERLPADIPLRESTGALLEFCNRNKLDEIRFSTGMMIVPGYRFRVVRGLVTNFHMPGSTLLMLIAALIGEDWSKVYHAALREGYRFLSYGDSSLLLPEGL
jgi:S-adenosylmethionine:tRNA ribosyltransferase-isomerase